MKTANQASELIQRLKAVNEEVKTHFSTCSVEELNWKPDSNRWSIAECLEHLMVINKLYFKSLQKVLDNSPTTFWERIPGLPNLFANLLLKATNPENRRKMKTAPLFEPKQSEFDKSIIDTFLTHNEKLIDLFERLKHRDPSITITSPAAFFITMPLGKAMLLLTMHEERHLLQAKEVLEFQKSQ